MQQTSRGCEILLAADAAETDRHQVQQIFNTTKVSKEERNRLRWEFWQEQLEEYETKAVNLIKQIHYSQMPKQAQDPCCCGPIKYCQMLMPAEYLPDVHFGCQWAKNFFATFIADSTP